MALKDIFKVNRKTFFDPTAWFGYDSVKQSSGFFWSTVKGIFVPPKIQPARTETFEEAVKRQKLTEEDIKSTQENYFLYALLFLVFAAGTIVYGFYLLIHDKEFIAWVISLAVTALLLSQAFRFHFWYFQIKNRKLGCTIQEWLHGKISDTETKP